MNDIYVIRNKATGLYWRGSKTRYSKEQRSPWADSPTKAWHCWQEDQIERYFKGHFHPTNFPDYEMVVFHMVEVRSVLPTSLPESSA